MVECLYRDREARVRASPASLRCGPGARDIYPSFVLVQPRKTRPCLTERLLIGRKESNQTNKQIIKIMPKAKQIQPCADPEGDRGSGPRLKIPKIYGFLAIQVRIA